MILVTGATGTIGREVVRLLAERGEAVRAMTRDPATAAAPPSGVELVRGDFADPASLAAAAGGAAAVFLLSAPGPALPEHDAAMLATAQKAWVRKVVKLSAIGTGDKPDPAEADADPLDWHLPGEQAVQSSGLAWAVLRPSSFASNALHWAPAVQAEQPIPNPMGTGRQGVVDPGDIAEVAVRALTAADLDGRVHTLTGPELLSVPDMADRIAALVGHPVGTAELPLDQYRAQLEAAGLDPAFVRTAVRGAGQVAAGGNAVLTDDVERILGRPARTFAAWAQDHIAAFTR